MKRTAIALAVSLLAGLPGHALAQGTHDGHGTDTPVTKAGQTAVTERHDARLSALSQTGGVVYSADEGASTITAIDLDAGMVRTVPVPVAPHNVDLTPDGRFLLAVGTPDSGDHGTGGHGHGDTPGLLVILDPEDLVILPVVKGMRR